MALAIDIQTFLTAESHSLTLLFIGVILLSYLLEDVAIVTAATLALQNLMSPGLALLAIFVGIVSGDLGLYYLGQVAQRVRPLRYQALTNKHFRTVRRKLHHHTFLNLFIIRFVPGLRTVGFTLSGFFSIPLALFLCSVLTATALWTLIVFSTLYYLGSQVWQQSSHYQWSIIPIAVGLLMLTNRLLNKSFSKGLS
ncbi:DedA family protein [Vibrio anguillarum]|uniref:DedA family protein n=1 Tax=Vibrio anguillarum TaxID=55601 RepID=A0A289GF77_VIBAN|nr:MULTISPECIES: DedA family protein [Vibrio]ASW81998.1 DedA family protein [Vibrio anguillarum]AZS24555.1 DedA family protein [Vibrio anguillarum]MBF4308980.1 DedA family protein [Vibrio anguillarum]MBF4324491.1 DedA family protein [Vibrio anguillarum]MBT2921700.1 DedA family protein [Vibrio anguillarum]